MSFMRLSGLHNFWCKRMIWILAFFWCVSLLAGIYLASASNVNFPLLMRLTVDCSVSIVGLAAVLFFPLVLSAIGIFYRWPLLIVFLCIYKGMFLGFSLFGIAAAFASAGWLVNRFILFSDSVITVFLFWFWFRSVPFDLMRLKHDFILGCYLAVFIGCLDYFIVSPFLIMLFDRL